MLNQPPRPSRLLAGLATLGVVAATFAVPGGGAAAAEGSARQQEYAAASQEFGVPVDVLLGVSYLESRWDTNAGQPSTSAGYGPMHLTDAAGVAAQPVAPEEEAAPPEDARGDDSREFKGEIEKPAAAAPSGDGLQTLDRAATLTGLSKDELRSDAAANIRGGAALLSAYQSDLAAPAGADSDVAQWYGAVARYSGAQDDAAAAAFADEVFATIIEGATRTTDDGQAVTLQARATTPNREWLAKLGLRHVQRPDGLECPVGLDCEWIPAPYGKYGASAGAYGNHDLGNRPTDQKIEYIIIHDTEGSYAGTINLVQDVTYVSWNYTVRSVDGHIAQHVLAKDVAWHAGNWYVNTKSVGVEHEGFAALGTWYTEAMYRTSSKLVRYLALKLGIPLDRQHILGHDNVPGVTAGNVGTMHWDPGPYWDWAHYMDLLKAPVKGIGTPNGGTVTIKPDYATNKPAFTGCVTRGVLCAPHGSGSLVLHTSPSATSPLLSDYYLDGANKPATMHISDHGARVETGQEYAVADQSGDWTAIWYLGQKGWFYNPASNPTALWSTGFVATPKAGKASVPVYGAAWPEAAAYPPGVPMRASALLAGYKFLAGQRYVVGAVLPSEYYKASTFAGTSPGDWTVIRGETKYVQIQFGHRVMYVNLDDVDIQPATAQ